MSDAASTRIRGSRDGSPRDLPAPPSVIFRRLRIGGLSAVEAGNITAWLVGLPTSLNGWTLREIAYMAYLRERVADGELAS